MSFLCSTLLVLNVGMRARAYLTVVRRHGTETEERFCRFFCLSRTPVSELVYGYALHSGHVQHSTLVRESATEAKRAGDRATIVLEVEAWKQDRDAI